VIACVDVDYGAARVATACLGFTAWTDAASCYEAVTSSPGAAADYTPGEFYQRELPYLLAVLRPIAGQLDAVIVDGYVWLGADKGLGAHLHDALGGTTPIIGVAKTSFAGATAIEVIRGASARPLYVTAAGIDAVVAADHVRAMHGEHRIPTLLKRVDQLARSR
jgi:deoxyribonuclease V